MYGEVITGNVHRFGENVTTDDVIAGKYKHETTDLDRLAAHLMENIRPGFVSVVKAGDFIVAGSNFGCGSSREQAPALIKHVGIAAVVAPSFARIFYRNAINIGLLLLTCDTDGIEEGDELTYDPARNLISIPGKQLERETGGVPADIVDIVQAGGLLAYVRERGTL
jgi:3-isopropylmalate/(R)-2-methylmalate dehydratase small subunit